MQQEQPRNHTCLESIQTADEIDERVQPCGNTPMTIRANNEHSMQEISRRTRATRDTPVITHGKTAWLPHQVPRTLSVSKRRPPGSCGFEKALQDDCVLVPGYRGTSRPSITSAPC
eukprot:jgi/Botrbrau1/22248/Bobra.0138s0010.1